MNVLHLCLSCFYIDNAGYQENHLIRENFEAAHNVLVVCSTESIGESGMLEYVPAGAYVGSDGAKVIRLPYAWWLPHKLATKLRVHHGLKEVIKSFKPDSILFHGCCGSELATVARYVKKNPEVLFYIDCHEDLNNSARSILSRYVLHLGFYRRKLKKALPFVRKILCVSTEAMDFLSNLYGVPNEYLEFFPLGGLIEKDGNRVSRRANARKSLAVTDDNFVFVQSGKFSKRKKLDQSLDAFRAISGDNLRFWIVGVLMPDVEVEIKARIAIDTRISFLGWKSTEQLIDLLCGADAYLQPGTQSVTMQNALCCGCPTIIHDVPSHQFYEGAGAILIRGAEDLRVAMEIACRKDVSNRRASSIKFSRTHLDYRTLASRYLRA